MPRHSLASVVRTRSPTFVTVGSVVLFVSRVRSVTSASLSTGRGGSMFDEITGPFEVGVTFEGEIIIGVGNVWHAVITPEDARGIAANLYLGAAEAQTIIAARSN
jgi:hypothetical protein